MSYFRPQNARKIAPRSVCSPQNSTQKVSRKGGWVTGEALKGEPQARLNRADSGKADLSGADLRQATLVETSLEGANLTACSVYGISAWNVRLEDQSNRTW